MNYRKQQKGFTLIETLVSVALLVLAITAPLSLASFSLSSSYYARDEVTAFYLAQEAIEAVRNVRDGNILQNVLTGSGVDPFSGIDTSGSPFTVDTHTIPVSFSSCSGTCPVLSHNGELYGYGSGGSWVPTRFTRTVRATPVTADEVRIEVQLDWKTSVVNSRTFTIAENLYRWVDTTQ